MQAIELYRKANRNNEAAKLLSQFSDELRKRNVIVKLIIGESSSPKEDIRVSCTRSRFLQEENI